MNPTIRKEQLLEVVKKNKDAHHNIFLKACEGFQKEMLKQLAYKMKLVRAGKLVNSYVNLPVPEDHTREYDRVVRMIELNIKDEIQLTEQEFAQFVMDDWQWKRQFANTASNYMVLPTELEEYANAEE